MAVLGCWVDWLGRALPREARYASDITRSALDLAATNASLRLANAETERRLDQVMKSYEEYFTGLNEESPGQKLPKELLASLLERPRRF